MNFFLLVECEKDSEFFGPSKTILVISLLLVHVSALNLMLLWAVILYSDNVQMLEGVRMQQLWVHSFFKWKGIDQ